MSVFRVLTWRRVTLDGKPTARMTCPECNTEALLDHEIADDGTVTPSVQCPANGCGFHEMVQLVGWQRGEIRSVT